jgi:hypothetical protein
MKNKIWILVLVTLAVAIYFYTKDCSKDSVCEKSSTEKVISENENQEAAEEMPEVEENSEDNPETVY